MQRCIAILFFLSLITACADQTTQKAQQPLPDMDTVRVISGGQVVGSKGDEGSTKWLGMPYAAPPVGALRWRAPRPPSPWEGVFEALEGNHRCAQLSNAFDEEVPSGSVLGSEDCLYLNVWAPAHLSGGRLEDNPALPVMVFIHGGGNTWGFAGQYDAERLAVRHDLVVVVINYRLGPFGWFAHPALRDTAAETSDDRTANFAILDMVAALEWVRENITAFGGDPSRVTIFGQSAGGQNVASLLASLKAKGLFHAAIAQSGYFKSITWEQAEYGASGEAGWSFLGARAVADRLLRDQNGLSAVEMSAALRATSAEAVLSAATNANGTLDSMLMVSDGVVLVAESVEAALAAEDTHNAVPFITGANKDETKLFNIRNPELVQNVFGVIPRARDARLYDLIAEYQSAMWRVLAVDQQARRLSAARSAPVYAYQFNWDEEGRFLFADFAKLIGAAHAMELPFIFDSFDTFPVGGPKIFPPKRVSSRRALSDAMMSYWAEFAYSGSPGRGRNKDLPLWRAWDGSRGRSLVLDTSSDQGIRLTDEGLTVEAVYRRLTDDKRMSSKKERCLIVQAVLALFPETTGDANNGLVQECA